jgi:hypothetical protein
MTSPWRWDDVSPGGLRCRRVERGKPVGERGLIGENGHHLTFAELAGVGEQLARGHSVDEITTRMKMVAEGVKTARVVRDSGDEYAVDLPIPCQVDAVINGGRTPGEAYGELLGRLPSTEFEGVAVR